MSSFCQNCHICHHLVAGQSHFFIRVYLDFAYSYRAESAAEDNLEGRRIDRVLQHRVPQTKYFEIGSIGKVNGEGQPLLE